MNTLLSLTIYPLWLQNLLYSIGRQSCSWTSLVCSCTSILKQPVAPFTSNLTVHLYNLLNFPINRPQLPHNSLARAVVKALKSRHVTSVLISLSLAQNQYWTQAIYFLLQLLIPFNCTTWYWLLLCCQPCSTTNSGHNAPRHNPHRMKSPCWRYHTYRHTEHCQSCIKPSLPANDYQRTVLFCFMLTITANNQ